MALKLLAPLMLLVALARGFEATWDTILPLTTDPQSQTLGYGYQRSVATDPPGNVHVVWLDQRAVPYQLRYRRFDRASGLWQPETALTSRPVNCWAPGLACDSSGNVHVVWHMTSFPGHGLWYKRFDAGAGRWLPDTLLDSASAERQKLFPSVVCRPGSRDVHIAWYGHADTGIAYQVFHREFRPDSGWRRTEQVSDGPYQHNEASLAVDSAGNLCVVWCGRDLGDYYNQVVCRRRVAGVWQPVELVSDLPSRYTQYSPCVAAGPDGTCHFAWHGRNGLELSHRVRYRNRSAAGWSDIVVVSNLPDYQQESPSILCRRTGDCHLVWRGLTPSPSGVYQLFYSCRDPDGFWTTPAQLTGRASGSVMRPAITADSDTCLHAVWYDASSGNQDVYYRRGHERGTGQEEGTNWAGWPVGRLLPSPAVGSVCRVLCPEGALVRLTDATGRVIQTGRARTGFALDCRSLASGIYFVAVRHAGTTTVLKLVRQSPSRVAGGALP